MLEARHRHQLLSASDTSADDDSPAAYRMLPGSFPPGATRYAQLLGNRSGIATMQIEEGGKNMASWRVLSAMYRFHLAALSVAILLLSISCAARVDPSPRAPTTDAASLEALVEVMGQRLALMPQVAEWKRAHDRPVRDRQRELQVLEDAVKAVDKAAQQAGVKSFPGDAVRRFYQAQIDTAVEIQMEILGRPAKPQARAPDLQTMIRPELDRLGTRIADLLVVQSRSPDRSRLEGLARQHWRVEGLESEAIKRLVDALERLLAQIG